MNNIERAVFAIWALMLVLTLVAICAGRMSLANVGGIMVGLGFVGQVLWTTGTC
jgi:hypothetical protein